jgi:hypothetical protein
VLDTEILPEIKTAEAMLPIDIVPLTVYGSHRTSKTYKIITTILNFMLIFVLILSKGKMFTVVVLAGFIGIALGQSKDFNFLPCPCVCCVLYYCLA